MPRTKKTPEVLAAMKIGTLKIPGFRVKNGGQKMEGIGPFQRIGKHGSQQRKKPFDKTILCIICKDHCPKTGKYDPLKFRVKAGICCRYGCKKCADTL